MNWFISQVYFITNKDAFVYDSISIDVLKVTLYSMHNVIFYVMLLLILCFNDYYFQYDFHYAFGYVLVIQHYT